MKRLAASLMTACLVFSSVTSVGAVEATPTESAVFVDGKRVEFDAYNIDGNNYFKLRDIAYVLKGTSKQFDVGYDPIADNIFLISNKAYTAVGGEMQKGGSDMEEATSTDSKLIKDGVEIEMTSYNINDNNYFKLRDLGEKFDFGVNYDERSNSVLISTKTNDSGGNIKESDAEPTARPKVEFLKPNDPSSRPSPIPGATFEMP